MLFSKKAYDSIIFVSFMTCSRSYFVVGLRRKTGHRREAVWRCALWETLELRILFILQKNLGRLHNSNQIIIIVNETSECTNNWIIPTFPMKNHMNPLE